MSRSAELIMKDEKEQKPSIGDEDLDGCTESTVQSQQQVPELFCEKTFIEAFCAAAKSDDPVMLNKISVTFAAHPTEAWATVDRICDEKAKEATRATQTGDYTAAHAAIEEHHSLAMVYGKLIAARVEWLNKNW